MEKLPRLRFPRKASSSVKTSEDLLHLYTDCWCPRASSVFNLLLSARITASFISTISDCDETFNYWEPTHYLLYGTGLQTWEYSPDYALRSYAYLLIHVLPAQIVRQFFGANKITVFYYIRFFLGVICAACETYFFTSLAHHFGNHVARLYFIIAAFSAGMFISSTAYLPSSFAMYMVLVAYGGWFKRNFLFAIFGIALGTLVGWPFVALLGIPIAFDLIFFQRQFWQFLKWSAFIFVGIMIPLVSIDTLFYGKQVITPLNIILYNIFTNDGPSLYGEESWTFYFINCFLNFNIVFPIAVVSLPVCLLVDWLRNTPKDVFLLPFWLVLSPIYLWSLVFFTQPHKEERFMFPIYPLIVASACIALSKFQELYHSIFTRSKRQHYASSSNWIVAAVVIIFGLLSVSRVIALFVGYRAPLDLYPEFHNLVNPFDPSVKPMIREDQKVNVCVGREWYRYPSSFFLPNNWNYLFIKSEFTGQLPQPFAVGADGTMVVPKNMNSKNIEEPSAYSNIEDCDFLVDVNLQTDSQYELNFSQMKKKWHILHSKKFLYASNSSSIFRAFYVPFLSSKYTTFIDYNLLKAKRNRRLFKRQKDEETVDF
ncbi:alpha-1,2-mannosyltransferase ALG9 isoform X2 [Hydra vulgaris]|uniref:Mannosyltransferase n=1 Tax=Hydra vulgaris TaxID=6087 RepID=A0ABM4B7T9_HYDVU